MDLNFAFCGVSRTEIRGPSPPTYPTPSVCSVTAFGRSVCSVVKTPPLHCPASGRLTRSARRYGDTESGFEVGLHTASPTIRPLRGGTTVGPGAQCTRAALGAWRPNACVLGGSLSRATDSIASAIKHCDLFPVNNKLRSVWLSLPLRRIDCRKTSNSQKTDLKATVL